jgi:hypothetical protein
MNTLNIFLLILNSIFMFYINAKYIVNHKRQNKSIKYKHIHYVIYINAFLSMFMGIYLILGGK